jgi:predicted P-loop ATPase
VLIIEQFLNDNYRLRRNMLSGKVEFKSRAELSAEYRPLTQEALNSIIIRALREGLDEECNPKADITMYVNSEEVRMYNPVLDFLNDLPKWDGQNHVAKLFSRIPGLSSEQLAFLAVWLRSTVAHWLQLDTMHGNEVVPVLIGAQGCGKTTFLRRLLPCQLREYYLDHLNLSNKFDKEMALTNNLLVNLDELEAIRPSQHAALKQTLSKNKVNGRPIFGKAQDDRPRYASFVSTTNNPHPLTDATGSRRYICMTIPKGQQIDNAGDIDYEQLYAQVLYEIRELNAPYWFNNEEVTRIQQLNLAYMQQKDIAEMVKACFRKPMEGEKVKSMNTTEMLEIIRDAYPNVTVSTKAKVELGRALVALDYERKEHSHVAYYKAVPLQAA